MSVDMSTDTSRSIYRPSVGRYDDQGKLVRICFFGTSEFTLQIVMEKRRGRQDMDPENGKNPFPQIATGLPRGIILKTWLVPSLQLFPGSFILGKKDPGSGWSRASQKVGGDKKTAGGRSKQVAILAFLYSL